MRDTSYKIFKNIDKIREMLEDGYKLKDIAEKIGVSRIELTSRIKKDGSITDKYKNSADRIIEKYENRQKNIDSNENKENAYDIGKNNSRKVIGIRFIENLHKVKQNKQDETRRIERRNNDIDILRTDSKFLNLLRAIELSDVSKYKQRNVKCTKCAYYNNEYSMCWHLVSTNKEAENEDNHCKRFVDNRVIQIYNENKKLFEDTKDELKLYKKLLKKEV